MAKKGKRLSRKGQKRKKRFFHHDGSMPDSCLMYTPPDPDPSQVVRLLCSGKEVNTSTTIKPRRSHHSKPTITEIMEVLQISNPTIHSIQRSLELLNILLDNYEMPVNEILNYGVDVIVTEGVQFENSFIQYYAIHAVVVMAEHISEEQMSSLLSEGLLRGLTDAVERNVYFVVQEAIEACTKIAVKSAALRNIIATCGSLRVSELLAEYSQAITPEFARTVVVFLREMCYQKPVPAFVLQGVANGARFLLRHEDKEIRSAALEAVFEVASDEESVVIVDNDYMAIILEFFDSMDRDEARTAFYIVGQFMQQLNRNTEALLEVGLVRKIMPILGKYATPDFGLEACSILRNILSTASYAEYIEPMLDSGLLLLLLGLLDASTEEYQTEACIALRSMSTIWKLEHIIRLAEPTPVQLMCNIFVSDNADHVSCAFTLLRCVMKAYATLRDDVRLQQAMEVIRRSDAYEFLEEYIEMDREEALLSMLASDVHTVRLDDALRMNVYYGNDATGEEKLNDKNRRLSVAKICATYMPSKFRKRASKRKN